MSAPTSALLSDRIYIASHLDNTDRSLAAPDAVVRLVQSAKRRSRGLLSGAQILTADLPAIHEADALWMLGRAGEHGASMHGLVVKWVVSGAGWLTPQAHVLLQPQCTPRWPS